MPVHEFKIIDNTAECYFSLKWFEENKQHQIKRRYAQVSKEDAYNNILQEREKLIARLEPIIHEKKANQIKHRKEIEKKYREEHKEQIAKRMKAYYSEPVKCEICNLTFTRQTIARHLKTKKHLKHLE